MKGSRRTSIVARSIAKALIGKSLIGTALIGTALVAVSGCHISGAPAATTVPIAPTTVPSAASTVQPGVVATEWETTNGQITVSTPTTPDPSVIDVEFN
jgi:hypothetical protein